MSNSNLLGTPPQSGGLGETVAGLSTSRLRRWVRGLKEQEGGKAPDIHKINGNMHWYKTSVDPSHEKYQFFEHFGWDGLAVLDYLKSQVPEEFGLPPKPSTTSTGSETTSTENTGNSSSNTAPGSGSTKPKSTPGGGSPSKTAESSGVLGGGNMKTYAMIGGGTLLAIGLMVAMSGGD